MSSEDKRRFVEAVIDGLVEGFKTDPEYIYMLFCSCVDIDEMRNNFYEERFSNAFDLMEEMLSKVNDRLEIF